MLDVITIRIVINSFAKVIKSYLLVENPFDLMFIFRLIGQKL